MPVKEMIEYLQTFPEDAEAGFIVADVGERVIYQVKELIGKGVSYCALCDGAFFTGEDVVMINKAMHTDGKKLDDWVRFFEGGDVTYIFEDICCSVPVQDAGAVEMAQSFRSRLPENQMRIEEADVTLLLSRADEKKYDILILSKDIAEAFRADTQPSEETVRIEISGTESTESGTGSPDARSDL